MVELSWPWMLLALPLPYLVRRLSRPLPRQSRALHLPTFAWLESTPSEHRAGWRWLLLAWLIWAALLLAASRPYWLGEPQHLPTSGRDLMLAVDLSGSMERADMAWQGEQLDRLTATKVVLGEFISRRVGDRLGLILFADAAYLQAPLTHDRQTVRQLLDETVIGLVGRSTAIGDAIGLAIKRLLANDNPQKVLILLTDGRNTAGKMAPLDAAKMAREQGVTIHTIGLGADEMLQRSLLGQRRVNPSRDLDEQTLQTIATLTGGRYFRARDRQQLEQIYAELDALEPIEYQAQALRPRRPLYHWPLALALALTLLPLLRLRGGANG